MNRHEEYTSRLADILKAVVSNDKVEIEIYKNLSKLYFKKYVRFANLVAELEYKDKGDEKISLQEGGIKHVWVGGGLGSPIFDKQDIEKCNKFIDRFWDGKITEEECKFHLTNPLLKFEDLDYDADVAYVFFGVPLNSNHDAPLPFESAIELYYYLGTKGFWKNGYEVNTYTSGNIYCEGDMKHDQPHGEWNNYSPTGLIVRQVDWDLGKATGLIVSWNLDDTKEVPPCSVEIKKNGVTLYSSYEPEQSSALEKLLFGKKNLGQPLGVIEISNSRESDNGKNGMLRPYLLKEKKTAKKVRGSLKKTLFDKEVKLHWEGQYEKGVAVGVWKEYANDKLIFQFEYEDGELNLEKSFFRFNKNGKGIPWEKL